MNKYKKIELTDIMNNPSVFDNALIEITGIAREAAYATSESIVGDYVGFLQQKGDFLLVQGFNDTRYPGLTKIAMLKTSNSTNLPITLQGKLTGIYNTSTIVGSTIPYKLQIREVSFAGYHTDGFELNND